MEKDERFWVAAALMSLYHAGGGAGRAGLFARLLERAGLRPPPGFPRWEDALAGDLDLFFEVNLPSPGRYRVSVITLTGPGLALFRREFRPRLGGDLAWAGGPA